MSTALLVIGAQLQMFEGQPVYNAAAVRETIKDLIQRGRTAAVTVIYLSNSGPPDEPGRPIHPDLAPAPEDIVLEKGTADPFYQTTLPGALAERGIRRLVIAGLLTELDIDTACRRAFGMGYEVALAADGHSTFDRTLPAAQIIAHHNDVLQSFATVAPAAEIDLEAPPALTLEEPLAAADLAAIRSGLAEAEIYERWLSKGDVTPFWTQTHPTRVTDALRQLWDATFTPEERLMQPAGWELGMAQPFIQPLALMPGFLRRTAAVAVAQAIDHLLQSPTNPFSPQLRKLTPGLWSYDARDFRMIYTPRVVQDRDGRERKIIFLLWLAPSLPRQNPFA